ncbi:VCBS repeat-containing protein [Rudanella lutea]|uniref:VCBS repeat-containing protein n=1 Tax=Rudanella lutea TaxID=451374 RepID=UPI00039B5137|nr:VCBS repeat-containing protein [Rudanella lutea]
MALRTRFLFPYSLMALLLSACGQSSESTESKPDAQPAGPPLFTALSPDQTGVTFANNLSEGLNTNVLMYEYFYNGGGVAVGDLNGDGLQDIYFSGNMVPNQLYLNRGGMKFTDVTSAAGVAGREGPWRTGVSMADVNGDGRLDIFVCYSGSLRPEKRTPQLFINEGPDAQGVPRFTDQTAQFGLDKPAQSTQGTFFDYDRDGDLDLLLLNHNPKSLPVLDKATTSVLLSESNPEIGLRLFENRRQKFVDITPGSGLSSSVLSYGLGAGVSDINGDGWPDIYVSNDYAVPDYLYLNTAGKGGAAFRDVLGKSLGHTSNFSMGNDVADINNDARPDLMTLDMLPEDNRRQKLLMAPDNYEKFAFGVESGFHHQYMRNMLHINEGGATPVFREVGQLAGVSNTDWSWAPLFADYDNDGWKDLFVSNGYVRDYTNLDFLKYMADFMQNRPTDVQRNDVLELVHQMPSSNVTNYLFRNQMGDGRESEPAFASMGAAGGMNQPSNSTGAAYADLDNDGDLDLVVNNTNQPAFIFQNDANRLHKRHYLAFALQGSGANTQGVGAKVTVYQGGRPQLVEQMPTRGFQSSVSPRLHVGLGATATVDSVRVVWPTGKTQLLTSVKADQILTLREADAKATFRPTAAPASLYRELPAAVNHAYPAVTVNDFKRQPLLVNAQSYAGPCLAKADVDGDGREDVYAGGSAGQPGVLLMQQANGSFTKKAQPAFATDKACEDTDALFFDANGDRFPDLYVCSGGYGDLQPGTDPRLDDRLYLNDGKGNFTKQPAALPNLRTSTSCVRVADVNNDGRPDLFVGGRVVPGRYPETPRSFLLINAGDGASPRFVDQTKQMAPLLEKIGMVTDAAWADLNGDRTPELVLVGEWMPVTVLTWSGGKLVDQTTTFLGKQYRGWWNKLTVDDLNGDGRPDLAVGNLGLNTQCRATDREPAELVYKDFDDNGTLDPVLCLFVQGKAYPHATRDELLDQMAMLRKRFTTYDSYANATLTDVFSAEELQNAQKLTANEFRSMLFVSAGAGKLTATPLPMAAQASPVFTLTPVDFDKDGRKDLFVAGNTYQTRLRFGRADANRGLLLRGDGKGNFTAVPQQQAGFDLRGDVRAVVPMGDRLLIGVNSQPLRMYGLSTR